MYIIIPCITCNRITGWSDGTALRMSQWTQWRDGAVTVTRRVPVRSYTQRPVRVTHGCTGQPRTHCTTADAARRRCKWRHTG